MTTTIEVIETLNSNQLRVRTALWLLPISQLADLADKAARLGISLADARQPILDTLRPEQRFLPIGPTELVEALESLCAGHSPTNCLLIANWDLLIAKLSPADRKEMWDILYQGFPHRRRALLFVMPKEAEGLLPRPDHLQKWAQDGRLVS